ncbi:hemerythrin domain-containing protein [Mycobacterium sp. ITM-2016-00317]|uniref:hemerythrin domain-containing protein n=1 Tax=Mycobacterium sp. ITM-2016-00317 TaxID=2099694 RepID=UPI00287F5BC0|nr:hemerythrin domain-containing protein [Mycobacterium sp. ITM-2016-00317]WNG87455.1 hemerythrin domain-containing protein [Mycobacterium sp. ITM-2016-00317]
MESLATQTDEQLGGPRSVLVRQKRDHVELDRLIEAVNAADGARRQELLTRLCRLVFPHAFAEESVLWPAIRRVLPDGEQLTLEIEREHQEINELFTELERTGPDEEQHRVLFDRIAELLRQDVRDEEDVLLPRLQAALPQTQLVALGTAWEAVRRTAPTRPHPVVARRPPGNVMAAPPLTLIDRSRDRLDRLSRRTGGTLGTAAQQLSAGLARLAGALEHIPPLTRGERPETRSGN